MYTAESMCTHQQTHPRKITPMMVSITISGPRDLTTRNNSPFFIVCSTFSQMHVTAKRAKW